MNNEEKLNILKLIYESVTHIADTMYITTEPNKIINMDTNEIEEYEKVSISKTSSITCYTVTVNSLSKYTLIVSKGVNGENKLLFKEPKLVKADYEQRLENNEKAILFEIETVNSRRYTNKFVNYVNSKDSSTHRVGFVIILDDKGRVIDRIDNITEYFSSDTGGFAKIRYIDYNGDTRAKKLKKEIQF